MMSKAMRRENTKDLAREGAPRGEIGSLDVRGPGGGAVASLPDPAGQLVPKEEVVPGPAGAHELHTALRVHEVGLVGERGVS